MTNAAGRGVLYLVPGLLCDAYVWRHQIGAFGDTLDIRVPDLTGMTSIESAAESLVADAPARFSLAGHSMGARVALEVYRAAPERVERLALLDTGTHTVRPGELEKRMALVALARESGMAALADRWLPPMVHPDRAGTAAFMPALRAMVGRMTPEIFARQVSALLARPDAAAILPSIVCPVLVGVGRQDGWSPPEQHAEIASAIPHARLVIFEDSGHMSPVEAAEAVTAALVEWMRQPPYER
jgi:pimeloyl-ACP methyl ester carboxylesterase